MSHQSIAAIHSHRKNDFKENLKTLLYNGDLSDYIFNASDTKLIYAVRSPFFRNKFSVSPAENGNDEEGNTCEDDEFAETAKELLELIYTGVNLEPESLLSGVLLGLESLIRKSVRKTRYILLRDST